MTIATAIIKGTPVFGRMFSVDKSTGLEEINAWPALMIMASFIWLAVAGLLGLVMPACTVPAVVSASRSPAGCRPCASSP